jgi:predicted dehydrogenase
VLTFGNKPATDERDFNPSAGLKFRQHASMQKENSKMDRVRLGIVGCGSYADSLAAAVRKCAHIDLAACFDVISERSQKFSSLYKCDQESSYENLLNRRDIDGVLLVTPNSEHAAQAEMAADRGKHVFVEKPIANSIDDARRMIAVCRQSNVVLMVGHLRRRSAGIRKAKALVDEGIIGDPVMVEASVSSDSGFNLTPDKFRWRGDDTGCPGGALMTSGIHHVDAFNYILGPIESVSAYFNKLYISAEVEDINLTICRFHSGLLGYLGSTYVSPYDNWLYLHGTRANLLWLVRPPVPAVGKFIHNDDAFTRLIQFEKGREPRPVPLVAGDPVLEEIDEFARCIRTGSRPETDGESALTFLAFIRAAIDSSRLGKPVTLEK